MGAGIAIIGGQIAIQALELAQVSAGITALIKGDADGVGSLAVQIAHKAGAIRDSAVRAAISVRIINEFPEVANSTNYNGTKHWGHRLGKCAQKAGSILRRCRQTQYKKHSGKSL